MSFHLIIDGYNVIRHSPELRKHEKQALEQGRQFLVKRLSSYQRMKHHGITVVFDGWEEGHASEGHDQVRGIKVVFSRRGEKADEVIKRLSAEKKGNAIVVTSDRELGHACTLRGSRVIESQDFLQKLSQTDYLGQEERKDSDSLEDDHLPRGTKKKGPSRRLSKSQRKQEAVLRKI